MSLGTQQCVSLARALSLEPELLLLDEPFSMLDSLTRLDLQDTLLRAWEQDRKIVVMVTHDVDEALYLADRIVLMTDGPAAHVGDILSLPFARPRDRRERARARRVPPPPEDVIDFLENHAHQSRDRDAEMRRRGDFFLRTLRASASLVELRTETSPSDRSRSASSSASASRPRPGSASR